jgi:ribose transport system permease protein
VTKVDESPPREAFGGGGVDQWALRLLGLRNPASQARQFGMIWIALVLLFVVAAFFVRTAVSSATLLGMLPWASITAIAATGETLVIQQRGLDFSVGGAMSLTIVIMVRYPSGANGRVGTAIVISLIAVLISGLVSGIAVVVFNMPSIVATLGVNAMLAGAAQGYSGGSVAGAAAGLNSFMIGSTLSVPNPAWIALVVVFTVSLCVNRTTFGRRFVGVGANVSAIKASGVRLATIQIGSYMAAGLCYGIAGIIYTGFIDTPAVNGGDQYLLAAVAAVVMGGTALTGGRGSILATAAACVFLQELSEVVYALGAPAATQYLVEAGAIALAMVVRPVLERRSHRSGGWRGGGQRQASLGVGNDGVVNRPSD